MSRDALEELVDTLLWEGYALYPYTPGSPKNATPTPFGIVYPPRYAQSNEAAFDELQVQAVVDAPPSASLGAEIRFLRAEGAGHEAREHRVTLPATSLAALAQTPVASEAGAGLAASLELGVAPLAGGLRRASFRLRNTAELPDAAPLGRPEALRLALLSTHVVLRLSAGRFLSPRETSATAGEAGSAVAACVNRNTWPVLASPSDDVLLAAAIVLPDHPQIAPQSLGSFFDGTEIEEALLLHIRSLAPTERDAIAASDPRVREALRRATEAGPDELLALHGAMAPAPGEAQDAPRGEAEARAGGQRFRRGGRVVLRLGQRRNDPYAPLLDGETATVERIYRGFDDRLYLAVSLDADPGQPLFRETGRFLYFFPDEVEALEA